MWFRYIYHHDKASCEYFEYMKLGSGPWYLAGCCGLIMFDSFVLDTDCALCISIVMLLLVLLYIYFVLNYTTSCYVSGALLVLCRLPFHPIAASRAVAPFQLEPTSPSSLLVYRGVIMAHSRGGGGRLVAQSVVKGNKLVAEVVYVSTTLTEYNGAC